MIIINIFMPNSSFVEIVHKNSTIRFNIYQLNLCALLLYIGRYDKFRHKIFIFFFSRWPFKSDETEYTVEGKVSSVNSHIIVNSYNKTENSSEVKEYLMNWLSVSADNIVILILLLALAIKFIFFENKGDIAKQLRFKVEDNVEEKNESDYMKEKRIESDHVRQKENESEDLNVLTSKMPFRQNFTRIQTISLSTTVRDWIDNKDAHIDEKQRNVDIRNDKSLFQRLKVPRSLEECLEIYKSEVSKVYTVYGTRSLEFVSNEICNNLLLNL